MAKYLAYCFFIVCGISCAAGKLTSKTYQSATTEFAADGIVFISLNFQKENNEVKVSYVETIQSAGTLKTPNEYVKTAESKYLIQLQDEKGRPLADCFIEDPLVEHKDVFSEDGKIEKGVVKFDEKIITLRLQNLSKELAKASVFEVVASSQPKYITNLNCK